jgi:P-type Mg2+ transporter
VTGVTAPQSAAPGRDHATASDGDAGAFWQTPASALLARLGTTPGGLTDAAAAERLATAGPNVVAAHRERPAVVQLLSRLGNPLVLLLLGAGSVSAFTGDRASAWIIFFIVFLSVTIDFFQEHRAQQSAARLRESVAIRATVIRDGRPREVPVRTLVPGDVVALSAGDLVPADGLLLEGRDLFVNQALLTGEPYPVEKRPSPEGEAGAHSPSESSSAVFMGTAVVSGTARVLLVRTGAATSLGGIGAALAARPPAVAFEVGIRSFGMFILKLAILMVLFVILVDLSRHRSWLESFLFAIALAVGLTPELLPMVITVTLSRGALRMGSKKVIVKRLAAIHDLGSMDVLCTDKTGTLTEARIRLERHLDPLGRDSERVLELAYLNSTFESGLKGPLDEAILAHDEVKITGWEKLDEVPFDFERRRLSVLVRGPGTPPLLIVKGALEDVVRMSSHYEDGQSAAPPRLDETARRQMLSRFEALSRQGFRVLGVAWKAEAVDCRHCAVSDEADLVFAGFAAFEDPPKMDAGKAIASLTAIGVDVKVVTGDSELVTQHVCELLGLPVASILMGAEIAQMDDQALAARAPGVTLFCRVTPAEKNRVILALRHRGHVVGYLGDGINDAPALHSADVGISVEGAVDVAKDAADLVLLEHDLGVLHDGVLEGRRTFGNILKYIMMGTSSNFGNMFSMAGASLLLPFLPMLPTQILLNNLLYDVSEIPIPMDSVDAEFMARPRRWDMAFIRRFMLVLGPVSSLFDFITFGVMLWLFKAGEKLFHTGWFVESLATQVLVIFVIRTRGNPLRSRPAAVLAITSCAVVIAAAVLPFTPLGGFLGFVPLPPAFFGVLLVMVAAYLLAAQGVKRWFYRRGARTGL